MDRELTFFDIDGNAYQPVRHANRATGRSAYRIKPQGASNRTEDCLEVNTVEEVARAMLVDGLPARLKALSGGPVSYLRFGADRILEYKLDPAIASRLGLPARSVRIRTTPIATALQRLRERFLSTYPDFELSGAFNAKIGSYNDTYRSRVDALLEQVATHKDNGWAVLQDVLRASQAGRGALPPFFDGDVNWRVPRARDIDPFAFDAALSALVSSVGDPAEAIIEFNEAFWSALVALGENTTFRDTRVVGSTVLAAVAPDRAISARYTIYSNAQRLLNDRTLFANKPMTASEYREVLALSGEIQTALTGWGWSPRDMWDVHGFVLATCGDRAFADDSLPVQSAKTAREDTSLPTNLILYGPPGTGKTYATAAEAVRLCGEDVPADRAELMATYRRLSDAGRIEFVTFHQSMAYEDFVEGLRPVTGGDGGAAGFELQSIPGIFRRIARRAETSTGPGATTFALADRQVWKMSIGDATKAEWAWLFDEAIEQGEAYLGFSDIDWSNDRFADRQAILAASRESGVRGGELSERSGPVKSPDLFRNQVKVGDVLVVSKGLNLLRAIGVVEGPYEYAPRDEGHYSHRRKVRWLWHDHQGVPVGEINANRFSIDTIYPMRRSDLNVAALERYANSQRDAGSGAPEPFVLVIDEINRANISKVLGELITLLEPDKRLGRPNELKVRLPYSADLFGVPANLHIVGTMNTADRSIALIDKALRRRFTFREMMPEPDLLQEAGDALEVDLPRLLQTLNDRIEYLLDREHQIGHAWLMDCDSRAALDATMRDRIIPLIAEYFFEDWGKVADVLGGREDNPFLERITLTPPPGMAGDEPRYRWRVRSDFAPDAYHRACG